MDKQISLELAQEYAEFCVLCDRKDMKLIPIQDYIKLKKS